ncbi:hypothetical protein T11_16427 [Trichinella zimbabwensis]|uniref:Uncharacterized protein n=1 Tax=Trichinella zimbabwensis TaxID=268475 RepID=A0A0V1I5G4_9BILA|nr:hypothetical protein T11_16427 [Trichinella zimbabwensis]
MQNFAFTKTKNPAEQEREILGGERVLAKETALFAFRSGESAADAFVRKANLRFSLKQNLINIIYVKHFHLTKLDLRFTDEVFMKFMKVYYLILSYERHHHMDKLALSMLNLYKSHPIYNQFIYEFHLKSQLFAFLSSISMKILPTFNIIFMLENDTSTIDCNEAQLLLLRAVVFSVSSELMVQTD